jgi:hypothetical protein
LKKKQLIPVVLAPSLVIGSLLPFNQQAEVYATSPLNLLQNTGFEDGNTGWTFLNGTGVATNNPKTGSRLAYLNKGSSNVVLQKVTITETGNYTIKGWVGSASTGGKMGIRDSSGQVIKSIDIYRMQDYRSYLITDIHLNKGDEVEVYVTGGNSWVNIDDFTMFRDDANITTFKVPGQLGESEIDRDQSRLTFYMPYGSDISKLQPEIAVSRDSKVLSGPITPTDFSKPHTYTIKTPDGIEKQWKVTCVVEDKNITINSSLNELDEAFNWAKWKANKYVQTGKTGLINEDERIGSPSSIADFIPSYWAGYAHRTAFYGRDFSHQVSGAHMIGLDVENFSMLKAFAQSATPEKKWYPSWALNFDGSDFKLDFRNINSFVREVPAVFELVQKGYEQYLWTGNNDYINDPVLWQYYTKAVTDFISLHDTHFPNGIAEGTGKGIFQGSASYNERGDEHLIEAGDGTAAQYLAFLSYAKMLEAKGETTEAQTYFKKAEDLKNYFNNVWGVKDGTSEYIRGYSENGAPLQGFGREASLLMATKLITEPGPKTDAFLNYLDEKYTTDGVPNIEALTYLPDTFFLYGRTETAWKWMKHIMDSRSQPHEVASQGNNGDYPEVSYTLLSHTVEGIAGIQPNAPQHKVATVPRLPQDLGWLELNHVPVGQHELYVKHDGSKKSTVKHIQGPQALEWEVQFYGDFSAIEADGKLYRTKKKMLNGKEISYIHVSIPVGKTATAEAVSSWTIAEIKRLTQQYVDTKDVAGSLVPQVTNSLNQAEHHLEKGNNLEAVQHLNKYVEQINKEALKLQISESAKIDLTEGAKELIAGL